MKIHHYFSCHSLEEHRAATRLLQRTLFEVIIYTSPHIFLANLYSLSTQPIDHPEILPLLNYIEDTFLVISDTRFLNDIL